VEIFIFIIQISFSQESAGAMMKKKSKVHLFSNIVKKCSTKLVEKLLK
jgi:hypothetical protein